MQVEIKTIESQPIVQLRFNAKREEIGMKLGPAYGRLIAHINAQGGEMMMMPMTRYFNVVGDTLDMAACIATTTPLASDSDIVADELPASKVASLSHFGPYENLQDTCAKLETWLKENGLEPDGYPREIYWTDPDSEPDPQKWRTEVVQHLKS